MVKILLTRLVNSKIEESGTSYYYIYLGKVSYFSYYRFTIFWELFKRKKNGEQGII